MLGRERKIAIFIRRGRHGIRGYPRENIISYFQDLPCCILRRFQVPPPQRHASLKTSHGKIIHPHLAVVHEPVASQIFQFTLPNWILLQTNQGLRDILIQQSQHFFSRVHLRNLYLQGLHVRNRLFIQICGRRK